MVAALAFSSVGPASRLPPRPGRGSRATLDDERSRDRAEFVTEPPAAPLASRADSSGAWLDGFPASPPERARSAVAPKSVVACRSGRLRTALNEGVGILQVWNVCEQQQARDQLLAGNGTAGQDAEADRTIAVVDAAAENRADPRRRLGLIRPRCATFWSRSPNPPYCR